MTPEASIEIDCFGGRVEVMAGGTSAERALREAEQRLQEMHSRLSRFLPDSELSRLNRNPEPNVAASPLMVDFVEAAIAAAGMSGGLIDVTRLDDLEAAGYVESRAGDHACEDAISLQEALDLAPDRQPAAFDPQRRWTELKVDRRIGIVERPPGLRLDSGGIAKGLAADLIARELSALPTYAVNCAGDVRVGGTEDIARAVRIDDPFGRGVIEELAVRSGGIATSGIGRRSWRRPDGSPGHHLIDPARGRPAYTGVVQATALAPTGLAAEVRAKCAVLAGPARAPLWLADGGVLVLDDGSVRAVSPPSLLAA
jgi:thiamine biosynthesis lipoprotein